MSQRQYVALLRGINVGGANIIPMAALASSFEQMGLDDVATYIQSGNVLFRSSDAEGDALTARIESGLATRFRYQSRVVVVRHDELKEIVRGAPKGFGTKSAAYRYDVIFLRRPVTAEEAGREIKPKAGVDRMWAMNGVIYFSRFAGKASQSRLARVIQLPAYRSMTIRNWNTTTKVLALMEARVG